MHFMAPELFSANEYSDKTDSYSFGIFLFELLFQKEPYDKDIQKKFALKSFINGISEGTLRPNLREDDLNKSKGLEKLVELMVLCWNSNPSKRPNFSEIVLYLEETHKLIKSFTDIKCFIPFRNLKKK